MPCHTCDICTVSLHCEFCCAQQDFQPVQIVWYKQYIETVSLLNEFVCVLIGRNYFHNICRILCTCIYQCEYSCAYSVLSVMKTYPPIHCMNTRFLQCVLVCDISNDMSL